MGRIHNQDVVTTGKASGGGTVFLLYFLGLAVTGCGVALAIGPEYSWQIEKVSQKLVPLGVQSGALIAGGLVVFALGLVAGLVRKSGGSQATVVDDRSDYMLVADQLSVDLAQVRTSALQTTSEVTEVAEGQRRLYNALMKDRANDGQQQNAIFRLASSVDQLNARVDERMVSFDGQMRTLFDQLSRDLGEMRTGMAAVPPMPAMPTAQAPLAPQPMADANPVAQVPEAPPADFRMDQDDSAMEFFDRLENPHRVDLDEPPAPLPSTEFNEDPAETAAPPQRELDLDLGF